MAAIAGVSSLSRSLTEGISREGRRILGGDMAFSLLQREAGRAGAGLPRLQGTGQRRSPPCAPWRLAGDKGSGLVEMKAVDAGYPTVGTLETDPPISPAELFAERNGAFGAAVDPALLARLDLKVGDRVTVGDATVELRASLVSEPDKIADGIGFGPRLLVSQEALQATGLVQPGSLVRWTYRLTCRPSVHRGGPDPGSRPRPTASCRRRAGTSARASTPIRALPATSSASRNS